MGDGIILRDRQMVSEDTATPLAFSADSLGHIDIITAGFPCQPHSTASRGRPTARDWWPETLSVIRRVRPIWVILENVPSYRLEHIDRACDDLESEGYAVWPLDIAIEERNHVRRRAWVVAYDNSHGEPQCPLNAKASSVQEVARRWRGIPEPVGMDDGLPGKMDRMKGLGNAIRPFEAELIMAVIQLSVRGKE